MDKAELLSVRLEKPLLVLMAKDMKEFHYQTKSDFLREAIREKHLKLEEERRKEKFIEALKNLRGSMKFNFTEKEYRKNREEIGDKIFADFEQRMKEKETNQKQPLQASTQQ